MTMIGNNDPKSPNDGRKSEEKRLSFKNVVSEGSTVILDVRDFVKDFDNINSIKSCLWKQTDGPHIAIEEVKTKPNFSFIAPLCWK